MSSTARQHRPIGAGGSGKGAAAPSGGAGAINLLQSLCAAATPERDEARPSSTDREEVLQEQRHQPGHRRRLPTNTRVEPELPAEYMALEEMFGALDEAITFRQKRGQPPTFEGVRPGAENFCKRKITLQHLRQLQTVVPSILRVVEDGLPAHTAIEILPRRKEAGLNAVAAGKSRRASLHRTLLRHARMEFAEHLDRLVRQRVRQQDVIIRADIAPYDLSC
jgi:hypothetical protein